MLFFARSQVQAASGDENPGDGITMLPLLLAALLACTTTVVTASSCDPSKYLCSGKCPPLPKGVETPRSEAVCSKDPDSDTCICWLQNPSSQLHTLFQCEAKINDTVSKIACIPPSHCFPPQSNLGCLIVMHCQCLLFEQRYQFHKSDRWKRVKAVVHTMKKDDSKNHDGHPIEKFQGDVREFSLKHLLFLLGFVIAPLLCWCLLNFFHEGKCRKKPPQPPEACPIPTSRSSTVDNMNNEDREPACEDGHPVSSRSVSVLSHTFSIHLPTAPEELDAVLNAEAQPQTHLKCESPPPYCESVDRNCPLDYGPPPAYDEAVRGSDMNIQQMWQTVFIVQPGCRENT